MNNFFDKYNKAGSNFFRETPAHLIGGYLPQYQPQNKQALQKAFREAETSFRERSRQAKTNNLKEQSLNAEKGKSSVIDFIKHTFRHYRRESWHHHLMSYYLQQVVEGKIKRLMVFLPPRHGKTETEERAVNYALGRNPNEKIIACGYGAARAKVISQHIRNNLKDQRFADVFPDFAGVNGNDTQDFWEIGAGYMGYLRAAGIGGSITGQGFDLGLIDDPVKSREEAESPTYQQKTMEWYEGTFLNRQDEENSRIVITMTRWHPKDLAGQILEKDGIAMYNGQKPKQGTPEWNGQDSPDGWHILCLPASMDEESLPFKHGPIKLPQEEWRNPAIAEYVQYEIEGQPLTLCDPRNEGEALWPRRFGEDFLKQFMADKHNWNSLYQQRPKAKGGNMINRKWFPVIPTFGLNKVDRICRFWDIAATKPSNKNKDPDFTAGALVALSGGRAYLLDLVTARETTGDINNLMLKTAREDKMRWGTGVYQVWEEEGGSSGKVASAVYLNLLQDYYAAPYRVTKNKEWFIEQMGAMAQLGNVDVVQGDWMHEKHDSNTFFDEAEAFPKGRHDDRIDAAAKAIFWLKNNTDVSDLGKHDIEEQVELATYGIDFKPMEIPEGVNLNLVHKDERESIRQMLRPICNPKTLEEMVDVSMGSTKLDVTESDFYAEFDPALGEAQRVVKPLHARAYNNLCNEQERLVEIHYGQNA
ncbi:MAG: terminase family protein [SAR324 cluster bacterium]|nr:terminase family protein [SAR324 cluster bacterium]